MSCLDLFASHNLQGFLMKCFLSSTAWVIVPKSRRTFLLSLDRQLHRPDILCIRGVEKFSLCSFFFDQSYVLKRHHAPASRAFCRCFPLFFIFFEHRFPLGDPIATRGKVRTDEKKKKKKAKARCSADLRKSWKRYGGIFPWGD